MDDLAQVNPEGLGAATPSGFQFQYIDLSSVCRGEIDWTLVQSLQFRHAPSRARRIVRAGDVLFGTVRPALQSHAAVGEYTSDPLVASTGFAVLRARPGVGDARFLAHYCLGSQGSAEARRMEVGSNYPAVNESDVRRFRILAPPLPEQRQIAAILDTIDDAIRKTEQIIVKLKQVKQGLLQNLLTRGIDDNGKLRDPERHPEQFKDSPLGRIPREWEVLKLDQIRASDTPITYGVLKPGPFVPGGIPLLQIQDVIHGTLDMTRVHRIGVALDKEYLRTRVTGGELVISLVGTIGRVAMLPSELGPANLHRNLGLVRVSDQHEPGFFGQFLGASTAQKLIRTTTLGSTQSLLNLGALRELPVPVPVRAEQVRSVTVMASLVDRQTCEDNNLRKLRLLKAGLMGDLLTGDVRVTNLLGTAAE